ncbi:MAG: nucleoside monophosphate kinase, partial [Patescibacteria group bacterium]
MNLLILGPQGSGKGTQAQLLSDKYGFYHLEMGNILRSISKSKNKHADVIANSINTGNLVPDEYVRLIAWDHINQYHSSVKGFIFEGYPRSLAQYEHVEEMLRKFGDRINKVIVVEISEEETIKRLSSRLTCVRCGRVYNTITAPPPELGTCECGGELTLREDDKPEAIK